MMYGMYTIFDRVAEEAMPPFTAKTDGLAIRIFLDVLSKSPHPKNDFLLYRIGEWDPETHTLTGNVRCQIPISDKEDVES